MSKYRYLKILLILCVPAVFILPFVWEDLNFIELGVFALLVTVAANAWDIWSARQGRRDRLWTWRFNPKTTGGIRIFGHPLEEYLFGFGVPIWIVLIWELVNQFIISPSFFSGMALGGVVVWEIVAIRLIYKYQTE